MSARDVIAQTKDIGLLSIYEHLVGPRLGEEQADAILAALDAAGYAVVPKEPTERMAMAFHEAQWRAAQDRTYLRRLEDFADRYKAMLTAAKETP